MMKKIFIALTAFMLLTSCSSSTTEGTVEKEVSYNCDTFGLVENSRSHGYCVLYDRTTKVMYVVSEGGYNLGNFTMLVNADGSPRLYEGAE